MQARMKNPAVILPEANAGIQTMMSAIFQSGIAKTTLDLVGLRVSQMNNCELCIGLSMATIDQNNESSQRLLKVATWQNDDCFTPAEQSALSLCEAVTTLNARYDSVPDARYDSVPDALWQKVEQYYDESTRAALVLFICTMNMFTRINVCTRQMTPDWQS